MKTIILGVMFLAAATSAGAETIYLKSGTTVNGRITEKTDTSVTVDVGGATATYYQDEIDRIEEGAAAAAVPGAPVSEAKKQLILKFIDVFGTRASMNANFEQMMASLKPEDAEKLRNAFKVDEIIDQLIPLYDRYFTDADLTALIGFYGSPEGKKLVDTIPQLMRDSVEVSAKYFEAKMPQEFKDQAAAGAQK